MSNNKIIRPIYPQEVGSKLGYERMSDGGTKITVLVEGVYGLKLPAGAVVLLPPGAGGSVFG